MPHDPANLPDAVEIAASPWKMAGLVVLGVGMTLAGLALVFSDSIVKTVVGGFGFLFFGAATVVIIRRALAVRGATVVLSRKGIRDVRVARETVAWAEIERISTWEYSGQRIMVLQLAEPTWERIGASVIARRTRKTNRALGADGLCVTAQGLKLSYDDLLGTALAYAEASRTGATS